ncbi:hypothetical protein [Methylovulum psychrotolerans]|uniref:Uncharacterized protein n=1 Tax=Methylovulum psychrotolerans TaxID=1704499 RepID=A0A1Z4C0R0_9GAMM|nr:hypothetical protein [Methylovulum psychrotolerans]ASF47103.1 hypothetical protein CEK71_14030 [Methylovulum psychrotolerans]MBT9100392.1 hypothetical protein [Methylovulum psychrotolerans]POZ51412.1 hypothetical protein AADEFJLK_02862 [Methylovulum psychrotolerans]
MKLFLGAALLAVTTLLTCTTEAASIRVGESGFYGRLNVGGYPPPQVYYRQPVAAQFVPSNRPPIYLRVRPGHARQWRRYCSQYNACNERVYFVKHDWYQREYAPRYQKFNRGNHIAYPPGQRR